MITIRPERPADVPAREALLDRAMGPCRFTKGSERLRAGNLPAAGLALVAVASGPDGRERLVGTVRLWPVSAGGRDGLLLGPLAVDPDRQGEGIGAALMRHALAEATRRGHAAVLLVGDAPYYARFGFSAAVTAGLGMPNGPEPRLLARELVPGALAGAAGTVTQRLPAGAARRAVRRPAGVTGLPLPRAA
ncbi:N-acetyltransferase [Rhodoplanes sp. TEM]|uniref:N-acetyltransferase n=1 Tax=Rhodoplanes tepidamans TaxID=200616 RepID=A0ABT5JB66_RHOTP|nr:MULTISPECIES: N-acetyltransferase [Rhodoplanes]MDC7786290.1 N-acetyltransferase [Rhodoplanes tepidamans]MDC7982339.1 N-acetyltransferase [Rhodoplanes sp. TEM]MDQ0355089.1 putative N-acetyltransferase YhbS [Rhodoplanes tepidamans]